MKLLRSFPLMALMLVLMSITGFCIAQHTAGEQGVGLLVVAGTLAALSWYVTEGPRGRTLPRWVANLLTAAVAINVVVDLLQNLRPQGDIMGVLGRFTVWLTLIKLYERKMPRDYTQLLALSALLMLVGCLQSPRLLFGLSLLAYTVMGLYVLLLYQMYCSFERAKADRAGATPANYRLAPVVQPVVGRAAALQARVLVGFIFSIGLAMSAVVFVVAPRGQGGPGGGNMRSLGGGEETSGFDDHIDLTSHERVTASQRIVATMRLMDEGERPVRLARPPLLRGAVLTEYNGDGRWDRPRSEDADRRLTEPPNFAWLGAAAPPRDEPVGRVYTQHFTIAPRERLRRQLFSLGAPLWIATDLPARVRFYRNSLTVEHESESFFSSYRIRATPEPDDALLARLVGSPRNPSRRSGASSPESNFPPEIRELAQSLLKAASVPATPPADENDRWLWNAAVAGAFTRHLQSQAFKYETDLSTLPPREKGRDPIARFLLETRTGYCEYYAAGLTALCQSVQVPARIVTGYAAVEFDPAAGEYVIRDSSAHAWTEVRTSPYRWATFDATPPSALGDVRQASAGFVDWLRGIYDRIEFAWYSEVAGYDSRVQSRVVGSLASRWSQTLGDWASAAIQRAQSINRAFDLGPVGYLWLATVAFALVLAGMVVVRIARRIVRLRAVLRAENLSGREFQMMLRQLGFYLDMLTVLERSGYAKPRWQPPRAYARVLRRSHPAAALLVTELTDLFYAARYGRRELGREHLQHAGEVLRSLAAALHVSI